MSPWPFCLSPRISCVSRGPRDKRPPYHGLPRVPRVQRAGGGGATKSPRLPHQHPQVSTTHTHTHTHTQASTTAFGLTAENLWRVSGLMNWSGSTMCSQQMSALQKGRAKGNNTIIHFTEWKTKNGNKKVNTMRYREDKSPWGSFIEDVNVNVNTICFYKINYHNSASVGLGWNVVRFVLLIRFKLNHNPTSFLLFVFITPPLSAFILASLHLSLLPLTSLPSSPSCTFTAECCTAMVHTHTHTHTCMHIHVCKKGGERMEMHWFIYVHTRLYLYMCVMAASLSIYIFLWLITFHTPLPESPSLSPPRAMCTELPIGCTVSADWPRWEQQDAELGFNWPRVGKRVVEEGGGGAEGEGQGGGRCSLRMWTVTALHLHAAHRWWKQELNTDSSGTRTN